MSRPALVCAAALCALFAGCAEEKRSAPVVQPEVQTPPPPPAPSKPPPPPAVAPSSGPSIALLSTEGNVQTLRNGKWTKAKEGELGQDDALRTDGKGSATVAIGDSQIVLEQDSQVTVKESADKVADLQLEKGRVSAELVDDDVTVRIRAAGSDAVAEAQKGSFSVFSDGHGLVAVASKTGEVKLSGHGGDVVLGAGEQGQVVGSNRPEKKKLRKAILLSVVWPGKNQTKARTTTIRGKSEVGTLVTVNGEIVPVGADGEFSASVPLDEGKNAFSVTARDLLGREKTETRKINVASDTLNAKAKTDDLWK